MGGPPHSLLSNLARPYPSEYKGREPAPLLKRPTRLGWAGRGASKKGGRPVLTAVGACSSSLHPCVREHQARDQSPHPFALLRGWCIDSACMSTGWAKTVQPGTREGKLSPCHVQGCAKTENGAALLHFCWFSIRCCVCIVVMQAMLYCCLQSITLSPHPVINHPHGLVYHQSIPSIYGDGRKWGRGQGKNVVPWGKRTTWEHLPPNPPPPPPLLCGGWGIA